MGFDDELDKKRLAKKINNELDELRPEWKDFKEYYPAEEVKADMKKLDDYRAKKGFSKQANIDKLTDGILVEKLFLDVDINDLFGEYTIYDKLMTKEDDYLLSVIPAHEYDDTFNNVDMICLVKNSLTDNEEKIFAIDCTSNASAVESKMNYRRTKDNVKGFTELKYFRNTNGFKEAAEPRAMAKVPRFVVGVDAELARGVLANYNDWTKEEIDANYTRIRYYLLSELAAQAKGKDEQLSRYFDGLLNNFNNNNGPIDDGGDFVFNRINEVAHSSDIGQAAINAIES